ncbi:MAG: efflux RND transporter permease subunit [Pseudomonadota bacterium]
MFRFALDKPIVLLVATLIICLFGLASVFRVPVQMIPDLDPRIVSVETVWPGATPQDIEKEILVEQEEFLRNITGLERMYSSAEFGAASIELEFPFGMDINEALILVNNALSQVPDYPENVDEPRVTADSFSANAFMYFYISALPGNDIDIAFEMDWVDDNIKPRLERVQGVSSIGLSGGVRRQVHVYLDPTELSARQLSVQDVRNAIRARNRDVSAGDMEFGKRRYLLRTLGRFQSVAELNDLIIAERDGAFVRLQDVGEAAMSSEERRSVARDRGRPALSMRVSREPGANVVTIKNRVIATVNELNKTVLAERGLYMNLAAEDARYVEQSAATVTQNLLIGAVLAVAVMLLFLRSLSATLIGAIGIPVCILAAFLGLSLSGRSINVISLAGIAFAIGMTLDNSIVALENINRHIGMGKGRFDAALDGIREVWPAILASTLTTVMVFLPVVFLKLEAGQLYSDIAVAISASIFMSMLVAITLIPAACSRFLGTGQGTDVPLLGRILDLAMRTGKAMARRILALSAALLANTKRQASALLVTLLATVSVLVFMVPAAEYLPEGEESKVFAFVVSPPGYNLQTMLDIMDVVEPELVEQVGAGTWSAPDGAPPMPPLVSVISFIDPGSLFMVIEPENGRQTPGLIAATNDRFNTVPGMRSFVVRGSIFSDNRGGTRSINIELTGRNLERLYGAALALFQEAGQLFEGAQLNASPSPTELNMSQPIAHLVPDWERAAELGISQTELGYSIWAYSDGAFVDEFFLDDEKIDMYLFASRGTVNQPDDLENVMLANRDGLQVPVSTLARVEETVGTSSITRIDGMRTVTLQIIPPREIPLETAVATVESELLAPARTSNLVPADIGISLTGATSRLEETRSAMAGNFLLAILIAYLLLVAVFSHWGYPLLIMTTVPIGISGGIVGLWLFNLVGNRLDLLGLQPFYQPFDVITMLGFLILIGTVVNNPILIVERSVSNLKERGMDTAAAIKEAVAVRLRPVMMSTITTVFGLSPLVLLPGEGSELYRGLGAIVLFGLLFSSLVTLTVLPALLGLVFRLARTGQSSVIPGASSQ